jgi:hypothetical protein
MQGKSFGLAERVSILGIWLDGNFYFENVKTSEIEITGIGTPEVIVISQHYVETIGYTTTLGSSVEIPVATATSIPTVTMTSTPVAATATSIPTVTMTSTPVAITATSIPITTTTSPSSPNMPRNSFLLGSIIAIIAVFIIAIAMRRRK